MGDAHVKKIEYKYDIAVSYENKSREFVKEVVDYLNIEGWKVFFDIEKKEYLLSEKLKPELYKIYQNESLVKVLFITEEYLKNEYTLLEARRSVSSVKNNYKRLIIINDIGENIPDPYKSYVYLDGNLPPDEIAYFIGQRVKQLKNMKYGEDEQESLKYSIKNIHIIEQNSGIIAGNNMNIGIYNKN